MCGVRARRAPEAPGARRAVADTIRRGNDGVERLPGELLRKGRFDEIFFVDLPLHEERKKIFDIHLRKRGREVERFDLDALSVALDELRASSEPGLAALLLAVYGRRLEGVPAFIEPDGIWISSWRPLSMFV